MSACGHVGVVIGMPQVLTLDSFPSSGVVLGLYVLYLPLEGVPQSRSLDDAVHKIANAIGSL
eukprot:scaffold171415_cov33-Tisochrysis_lutea.AAC.1